MSSREEDEDRDVATKTPLLDTADEDEEEEEEEEDISPISVPRESMEETTQHLIEDLQMERLASMSRESGFEREASDDVRYAERERGRADAIGPASAGTLGENAPNLPLPPPPAPFRSVETFLSTASSPRGRAQTFLWKSSRVVSWCRRGTGFTHGKRSFGTSSAVVGSVRKVTPKGNVAR